MTPLAHPRVARSTGSPIVDIVFSADPSEIDAIFGRGTRKLIGVLHRRFWPRRRAMLLKRAIAGQTDHREYLQLAGTDGEVVADLRNPDNKWDDRVREFLSLRDFIEGYDPEKPMPTVLIRDWADTEAGVLVDGRAVPGCVLDLAVALSLGSDLLRAGETAFWVDMPEAEDSDEFKLWSDLISLAEDRLGIERGTVKIRTVTPPDDGDDDSSDSDDSEIVGALA